MEKYDHIQTGLEKIFGLYGDRLYGVGLYGGGIQIYHHNTTADMTILTDFYDCIQTKKIIRC